MRNEIRPYKYEEELINKISIPKEDMSNLVNDINQEILKLIRELLKKSWENTGVKDDDNIPRPPYSKLIKNEELIIKNDKKIPEEKKGPTDLIQEKINIPNIPENKVDSESEKNILEDKLKGVSTSNHTISDYSTEKTDNSQLNKVINTTPLSKPYDPYREVF